MQISAIWKAVSKPGDKVIACVFFFQPFCVDNHVSILVVGFIEPGITGVAVPVDQMHGCSKSAFAALRLNDVFNYPLDIVCNIVLTRIFS